MKRSCGPPKRCHPKMLIFGAYAGQRLTLEVPMGMKVSGLKEMIQEKLGISVDLYRQDKKVLVLSYAGADLGDHWVFSDLGIVPGTTIRVELKEEVKPALFIKCTHNQETINIYDDITIAHMQLDQVRSMASRKSGLPVGIFRLTTVGGVEMYDSHRLEDYGVDVGHTICMETWDGWDEFLILSIRGFTPQVMAQIGGDEVVARYQMKVAIFIAAHFGHVDLARGMLRQGIKSDEPTGYHPARQWCKGQGHIDALNCPVHEATLSGQLGVLRLFVNQDVTCLKAKDGNDLEPLNIALRKQIKNCASFILTKQWSKISINKNFSLHLATYTRLKKWCERAKERALLKYGQSKTTLKRRNFYSGPLISHGILVDGFSQSKMTGKSKDQQIRDEKEKEKERLRRPNFGVSVSELMGSTEDPETYFKTVGLQQRQQGFRGGQRWSRAFLVNRGSKNNLDESIRETGDAKKAVSIKSPADSSTPKPSTAQDGSEDPDDVVAKLPNIMQRMRMRIISQSQPNLSDGDRDNSNKHIDPNTTRAVKSDRDKRDVAGSKSVMAKLTKSKNAYFLSTQQRGGGGNNNNNNNNNNNPQTTQPHAQSQLQQSQLFPGGSSSSFNNPPPPSDRSDRSKIMDPTMSIASDRSELYPRGKSHTAQSMTSASSNIDDVITEEDSKSRVKKITTRRPKRIPKARSNEGTIPLPLVSLEQDRRPFFYHQGQREEDIVEPALDLVSKYNGHSSRERAIESLTMANSFSEKPWLGQVRLALNLTSNSIKRNVRKLRQRSQRVNEMYMA